MSEEILEQQSEEELEEAKLAAVKSSGRKIKVAEGELPPALAKANAAKKKDNDDDEEEVKEDNEEEEEGEEEVDESVSIPKTKAGMIKALYDQLNTMKKSDLSDSFSKIMGSTLTEEEEADEDEEEEKPMESKKLKKEDLEIDVKEDIEAIVNGEDLSEDFKTKASTIFEAAVSAKVLSEVNSRIDELETNYKKEITEAKEEHLSTVTEKVDGYLNYVTEEWMKENELAVEKGIRSELVEDFMTGLKNLFTEHYIDIPEEKVDLVDDLFEKVEELEQKLDESINTSVDIKKELAEYKKAETLREVSEGLADTEKEKLGKLADGIDFEDKSQYSEKLEVIKENYFPKQQSETITEELENTEEEQNISESTTDPIMSKYASALTRLNK
jgi:hypothetical protein